MPEVLIVRHGVPIIDRHTPIRGRDLPRHVEVYEHAPLDLSIEPSDELRQLVRSSAFIVTSTLRRSIESASILAPDRQPVSDPLFDEAGIPTAITPGWKLSPKRWGEIARVLWFFGWSPGTESLREASARADICAARLEELAARHGSVAFIGHGMLNTLIVRAMRRRGWRGRGHPRRFWGWVRLRRG